MTNNLNPYQEKFQLTDIFNTANNEESVKFTDLENFFDIYQDKNSYYRFNLNSTVYISIPQSRLKTFLCKYDMHWPTISYQIYGPVRLAWILMKINGITQDISFNIVPAGSSINYPDRGDITKIIDQFTGK